MLEGKIFSIVDIETTGTNVLRDQIIEIAIIQIQNNEVIAEYSTFLKPKRKLNPWISELTGITDDMLKSAPRFGDVAGNIFEMLSGTIFVAHNARFDYTFLKQALKKEGLLFNAQMLCTVRLSRKLFPEYKKHSMDALIERFSLTYEHRHRAYDDALLVKKFLDLLPTYHSLEHVEQEIKILLKQYVLPSRVPEALMKELPEKPGIYKFYGQEGTLLYVGKSINIKDRVHSHFTESRESSRELKLFQELEHIDWQETYGEFGALLLESALIKNEHPLYNRRLRRVHKMTIVKKIVQKEGYFTVHIDHVEEIPYTEAEAILGIFKSKKQVQEFLLNIARTFSLCPKVLGLEKNSGSCFSHRLGKCHGACVGEEFYVTYNARFLQAFEEVRIASWPFPGPVMVREASEENPHEGALYIIDKWCLLGEGVFAEDGHSIKQYPHVFDFDQYKLLSTFLLKKVKKESIQKLTYEEMKKLFQNE